MLTCSLCPGFKSSTSDHPNSDVLYSSGISLIIREKSNPLCRSIFPTAANGKVTVRPSLTFVMPPKALTAFSAAFLSIGSPNSMYLAGRLCISAALIASSLSSGLPTSPSPLVCGFCRSCAGAASRPVPGKTLSRTPAGQGRSLGASVLYVLK
ncbi:hypothetical protein R80B4_02312 [Fibrobacteres bacterium R8-0-B4]